MVYKSSSGSGVSSFNGRTGAVTLLNADVTSATGNDLSSAGTPTFTALNLSNSTAFGSNGWLAINTIAGQASLAIDCTRVGTGEPGVLLFGSTGADYFQVCIGAQTATVRSAFNNNGDLRMNGSSVYFTANSTQYPDYSFGRFGGDSYMIGGSTGFLWNSSGNSANIMKLNNSGQLGLYTASPGGMIHTVSKDSGTVSAVFQGTASQSADTLQLQNNSSAVLTSFGSGGLVNKYNTIATAGLGVPAVYGAGRATAQTGANASVSTYTVGAADGSFYVSANVNVTAYTAGTITAQCSYTDETNTARTLTFTFTNLTGTLLNAINATGPYEGLPVHIRAKAGTAITILTTVSLFTGTYNVEGLISQLQ